MRLVRHKPATLNLPTLRLEGGLFLPDVLEKAASGTARLQTDVDYGIPKGLKQKDEYSRAFQIASAQWKHFEKQMERTDLDATHATATFTTELLRDALGYPTLGACTGITVGDRHYPVTHIASNGQGAQLPIIIAPHTLGLDDADSHYGLRHADGSASGVRKKSPFQLMQELLNASPDHQWGLVTNGKTIRLLRDAATLTRPSYLDIDVADLLSGQRYAEFAYAWRLLHASRAGLQSIANTESGQKPPVAWETWRETGQEEGTRVRNGLRLGVTQALLTFGNGFIQHPSNDALRTALQNGELSKEVYFQQLLRLIYRLIFVFSVEERGLLQTNTVYAEGYALARLRDLSLRRRARNRFDDLWESMRIVFKGLDRGEPRLGLPALGGLFNEQQCSVLDTAQLSNAHLLVAMQSMRWAAQAGGSLAPIDYRNMGVEELGSVYESLLELVPEVDLPARSFGFVGLTSEGSTAGNERKLTGSYYTPDSLVQELIKSALLPVIEARIEAKPANPVEALLSIKVCDPACGSGHFLLAAARKLAERLAALRSDDGVVSPAAYRHALREVIARCIYGVDRNPMAIELARTALWLEGFEEGRPLSFLDHHLQVGDALLGLTDLTVLELGIPKDAFKALSGDDKVVCKELSKTNAIALKQMQRDFQSGQLSLQFAADAGLQALKVIEGMSTETPDEVLAKEQAYRQFLEQTKNNTVAHAADLFLAAFLSPKTGSDLARVPTTETLFTELSPQVKNENHAEILAWAQSVCRHACVFHWPLAFPQVFASGGFDCMLGNPPWEMLQLDPQEFFATRVPAIANAQHMTARDKLIEDLKQSAPELFLGYWSAVRTTEASQLFVHSSGRYPTSGFGRLNLAYLFAELFLDLKRADGRSGVVVPSGIATDSFSQHLFNKVANGNLVSFYDFENSEAIFVGVHRSYKFCLLTLGPSTEANFVCFATNVNQLDDSRRRFKLRNEDFVLLNPNTGSCPVFRSNKDAELTKKIYRSTPVLWQELSGGKEEVNLWGLRFMLMFMMNTDSHRFQDSPTETSLPLFEAKLIHKFDHRWATFTADGESRDMTLVEKQDPYQSVRPRYWVEQREVWLRVANLPDNLRKSLAERHEPTILLSVAWLLFSSFLTQSSSQLIYPAWQTFVQQHPFAKNIAPTSMGLCGNNPPCVNPLDDNYLPAQGSFEVTMSKERADTVWYAVDPNAKRALLESISPHTHLANGAPSLVTPDDALAFAEIILKNACPKWLMGWRGIARATDERSVIGSVIPLSAVGNSCHLLLLGSKISPRLASAFLGNISCLVFDFIARQKIGGANFNFYIPKQLPVLPPDHYTEEMLAYIVPRVLELTYTAHDLADWARDLGYDGPPFPFNPERRAQLSAELDAYYAHLYGLSRDELRYILDPSEIVGEDYPSETFRVLKNGEIRDFGEFRTQRLVLDAWDSIVES